jgi:hypothetical protein
MAKCITPEQSWALSFTPLRWLDRPNARGVREVSEHKRFAKPGEQQPSAIKRLMSALKRKPPTHTAGSFPQFHPGMTTAEYVRRYQQFNNGLKPAHDLSRLERPAPYHTGPEVVLEPVEGLGNIL